MMSAAASSNEFNYDGSSNEEEEEKDASSEQQPCVPPTEEENDEEEEDNIDDENDEEEEMDVVDNDEDGDSDHDEEKDENCIEEEENHNRSDANDDIDHDESQSHSTSTSKTTTSKTKNNNTDPTTSTTTVVKKRKRGDRGLCTKDQSPNIKTAHLKIKNSIDKEQDSISYLEEKREALEEAQVQYDIAKMARQEASKAVTNTTKEVCEVLLTEKCFWNEQYRKLIEHKKVHGDTNVNRDPRNDDDYIRKLGVWVGKQRREYRQEPKAIPLHRIIALDRIGFVWEPEEKEWDDKIGQLEAYIIERGHCNFSMKEKPPKPLYNFVRRLRKRFLCEKEGIPLNKNDKTGAIPNPIRQDRLDRLKTIGFTWDDYESEFNEGFEALMEYQAQFDDCAVPDPYPSNPALLQWVKWMRREYKKKLNKERDELIRPTTTPSYAQSVSILNEERLGKLEGLGFCWNQRDVIWDQRFKQVTDYLKKNETLNGIQDNEKSLHTWLMTQKSHYKKLMQTGVSALTQRNMNDLKRIGYWPPHYIKKH